MYLIRVNQVLKRFCTVFTVSIAISEFDVFSVSVPPYRIIPLNYSSRKALVGVWLISMILALPVLYTNVSNSELEFTENSVTSDISYL